MGPGSRPIRAWLPVGEQAMTYTRQQCQCQPSQGQLSRGQPVRSQPDQALSNTVYGSVRRVDISLSSIRVSVQQIGGFRMQLMLIHKQFR
jgi:hypothetical protein